MEGVATLETQSPPCDAQVQQPLIGKDVAGGNDPISKEEGEDTTDVGNESNLNNDYFEDDADSLDSDTGQPEPRSGSKSIRKRRVGGGMSWLVD